MTQFTYQVPSRDRLFNIPGIQLPQNSRNYRLTISTTKYALEMPISGFHLASKFLVQRVLLGSPTLTNTGHANFLDVLVGELDISDDEDEIASPIKEQSLPAPNESKDEDSANESEDDDSESDDGWQEYDDSSDDEFHTLVRTVSGRASTASVKITAERQGNTEPTQTKREGYFGIDSPGSTGLTIGDALVLGKTVLVDEEYKKDAVVSVAIVSPSMTPLASPMNDIGPSGAG